MLYRGVALEKSRKGKSEFLLFPIISWRTIFHREKNIIPIIREKIRSGGNPIKNGPEKVIFVFVLYSNS